MGVELPDGGTVVATHTITSRSIVGTGVTLLASILPARRATRVPPIAAVREGAALPSRSSRRIRPRAGSACCRVAGGDRRGHVRRRLSPALVGVLLGGGVLGLFAGIAMLAPRLVEPLARLVGWPARRAGGVAGELAGANAVRNPGRTASTAAALMIGITLVTSWRCSVPASARHQVGDHQAGARGLRDRRPGGPAVPGRRGRQARGDQGRHGGVARALRRRAGAGQATHDQRASTPRRSRTSTLQLDHGLDAALEARRPTARS